MQELHFEEWEFSIYFVGYVNPADIPSDPKERTRWCFQQVCTVGKLLASPKLQENIRRIRRYAVFCSRRLLKGDLDAVVVLYRNEEQNRATAVMRNSAGYLEALNSSSAILLPFK